MTFVKTSHFEKIEFKKNKFEKKHLSKKATQ